MPAASLSTRLHLEQRRPSRGRRDTESARNDEHAPLLGNGNSTADNSSMPHSHLWGDDDSNVFTKYPKKIIHTTWKVLASNYVNVFLVFVPAGIIAGMLGADPTLVFTLNFIAIIPLAALLSFATEELAAEVGQTIGGLLNASFGNAVELIVSVGSVSVLLLSNLTVVRRLASLLFLMARFASYKPACSDPFSRIFFLSLDSASFLVAGRVESKDSTRLQH
jgi:hypothetical protein